MGELLGSLLADLEVSLLQIGEEITTMKALHNNVNVVLVLEDIKKPDNIGVLTHLQDLDFPPLKLDILDCHFLL